MENNLTELDTAIEYMIKANAQPEYVIKIAKKLYDHDKIDYTLQDLTEKVYEALTLFKGQTLKGRISLQCEVLDFVTSVTTFTFSLQDIYTSLHAISKNEKTACRMAIKRLVDIGEIENYGNRSGVYRKKDKVMDEIDYLNATGEMLDLKWPFQIERLCGIMPKNIIVVTGSPDTGKGHPDGTKILSETGWVNIEDLKVGDEIYAQDGTLTKIKGIFPRGEQQCFEFVFNDRTAVTTDFEHLWSVMPSYNRNIKTTGRGNINKKYGQYETIEAYKILARVGGFGKLKNNFRLRIPQNKPIQYKKHNVILDPYLLGVLLGDGSLSKSTICITTGDEEIINNCKRVWEVGTIHKNKRDKCWNVNLLKMQKPITELGLLGHRSWEKFIPESYLFNSVDIRLQLLRGLMDTDGDINKNGQCVTMTTVSQRLCDDVAFLVRSLGGKAVITSRYTNYRNNGEYKKGRLSYRINITLKAFCPFSLKRKTARYTITQKTDHKKITEIKNAGIQKTTCISIEHPSGLYITQGFIVTHNTAFLLDFIRRNMMKYKMFYFSSEMGALELKSRLEKFPQLPITGWNFTPIERSGNFADVIQPDDINVIDFLEIHEDFYLIGKWIKEIFDKLNKGIAVIAIQKNTGKGVDIARGGVGSLEKPRLYLSLSNNPHTLKIVKAKNWMNDMINPNGLFIRYKIVGGCQFKREKNLAGVECDWEKESET